ncbi:MAG TPA: class II aldolase/adducin family protein [Bacilli bacterium]|nr:class II aldolase/adducin family protein [Bacilli bacterium]
MSLQGKVVYYILTGARKSKEAVINIAGLRQCGAEVYVILTEDSKQFVNIEELVEVSGHFVRTSFQKEHPDHSLPLEDLVVCAPATYNTVNKIANGIADNLATSLVATAIGRGTPIYLAPNMNYDLWRSPITQASLDRLRSYGVNIVHPQVEDGKATMAETLKVFDSVVHDFVRIRYPSEQAVDENDQYRNVIQKYVPVFKMIAKRLARLQTSGTTAGCISMRVDEGFLVTASGAKLGELADEDVTLVLDCQADANRVFWSGNKAPSSETPLHAELYDKFPDVNAVLHTHCPELTYSSYFKSYRTSRFYSYGTFEFGAGVAREMQERDLSVIVAKDHGQVVIGSTFEEAYSHLYALIAEWQEVQKAELESSNERETVSV